MKSATLLSSMLTGTALGTTAGLAVVFESWPGLVVLLILFFAVYKWVFGAEVFSALKAEKKRRGQYWFEPMNDLGDLRFFAPVWGRMLIFFLSFTIVTVAIVVPKKMPNQRAQPTAPSGRG